MNTQVPVDLGHFPKAVEHVRSILIEGEVLEGWAIQRRIFALTHRRILVAATSGRLIQVNRGLLGGFDIEDYRWQDLKNSDIHVGILAAQLTVAVSVTSDMALEESAQTYEVTFPGLCKNQAEELYRLCKAHEQAWREKRRVRDIEELRAKSGGVQISNAMPTSLPGNDGLVGDATARLQEAKRMLDANLISDSEYEAIKTKITSNM